MLGFRKLSLAYISGYFKMEDEMKLKLHPVYHPIEYEFSHMEVDDLCPLKDGCLAVETEDGCPLFKESCPNWMPMVEGIKFTKVV